MAAEAPKSKPKSGQPVRHKHVPQRTCAACRRTAPKRELVRVVRTLDGRVAVDEVGKRAGRGAYLCRSARCWDTALRRQVIEHALSTTITPEDREALVAYGLALTEQPSAET